MPASTDAPSSSRDGQERLPAIFSGDRRRQIVKLAVIAAAQALAAIGITLVAADAVKQIVAGGSVTAPLLGLGAAAAFAAILRWLERLEAERLGQAYVLDVRQALLRRITRASALTVQSRSLGAMMLRFTGDMTALRNWAARGLSRLIIGSVAVMAGAGALIWVNPIVGAAFVVGATLVIATSASLSPQLTARTREVRRRRVRLARTFGDLIACIGAYQAFQGEGRAARKIRRQGAAVAKHATRNASIIGAMQAVAEAGSSLMPIAVMLTGLLVNDMSAAVSGMTLAALILRPDCASLPA